jgi:anthranilate/para-aminobenzoate synthase component II
MIIVVDNTQGQRVIQFLPKLLEYLNNINKEYVVIKGAYEGLESLRDVVQKDIEGIILSGSPMMLPEMTPQQSSQYITSIDCITKMSKTVPMLGICFGCQLIHVMFGGSLENIGGDKVVCQKIAIDATKGVKLPTTAKFCCKYAPKNPPTIFKTIGTFEFNKQHYVGMFKHKRRPLWGVMFHPEALKSTHCVLDDFIEYCQQNSRT